MGKLFIIFFLFMLGFLIAIVEIDSYDKKHMEKSNLLEKTVNTALQFPRRSEKNLKSVPIYRDY